MKHKRERVVLITGGSKGIGSALIEKFKQSGDIVVTCARSMTRLESSNADFKFECDVSRLSSVQNGIKNTIDRYKKIDVLINNAGISGSNSLEKESSNELWHQIIDVNLHGTYYFCKEVIPYIPPHQGRIINMGSVLSLKGVPDQSAYSAAKHAVLGFSRALAHHLASKRITVNVICPSWVHTDMAKNRWKELNATEEEASKSLPIGRVLVPNEVAELAFFLSSEEASGITGQAHVIDGGTLA